VPIKLRSTRITSTARRKKRNQVPKGEKEIRPWIEVQASIPLLRLEEKRGTTTPYTPAQRSGTRPRHGMNSIFHFPSRLGIEKEVRGPESLKGNAGHRERESPASGLGIIAPDLRKREEHERVRRRLPAKIVQFSTA